MLEWANLGPTELGLGFIVALVTAGAPQASEPLSG